MSNSELMRNRAAATPTVRSPIRSNSPSGGRGRSSRPTTPSAISATDSAIVIADASESEQPAGPQVAVSESVKSSSEIGQRIPPTSPARPSARTRVSGGG